ncbi:ribose 5-phosphate isomerase B [Cerasicoccus maritimus]|uniref:ribose 5-phosphate isomerase B n=1 Tax=Cerasicoccus maritimus TaxID=490089 RepID=UPI002852D9F0|nr:ribose 5-phosphate isomerase B [Cerasicoccus maritimus]
MKISIGSDHGGYDLKTALVATLQEDGHEVIDRGANGHDSVDYPDFGEAVAKDVTSRAADYGVLICTTGIGISISANKVHGIRAAVCHNEDAAEFCRLHNNANIICFGQKYDTPYMASKMTRIFLATEFSGGERHERRLNKITAIEDER